MFRVLGIHNFNFPFSFFSGYGGELPRLDDECIKTVIDSRKYLFYTALLQITKILCESLETCKTYTECK